MRVAIAACSSASSSAVRSGCAGSLVTGFSAQFGLELVDVGHRGRSHARDLGLLRLHLGLELCGAGCCSCGDACDLGFVLLRRGGRRRRRLLRGDKGDLGVRTKARADPELGLEQAAVLLGERVCNSALGDEAERHEDFPERPPAPILFRKRGRQLIEGQETLVDHELA